MGEHIDISMAVDSNLRARANGVATVFVVRAEQYQWRPLTEFIILYF
jgi:hypothetical protein